MTLWLVLGACALVGLTFALTWHLGASVGPVLRQRVRRKVVVTTKSGASWRGVLVEADRACVVLRGTEYVGGSDGQATVVPVDGELLILRPDIDYMQLP